MEDESGRIPIVRVGGCLLVSIQMTLHDPLLEALADELGRRLAAEKPRAVAIDLASVGLIDSFTTRVINQIAATARLMGVKTVLSGIQPAVAITMVEMGVELVGVDTFLSVDNALAALGIRTVAEAGWG